MAAGYDATRSDCEGLGLRVFAPSRIRKDALDAVIAKLLFDETVEHGLEERVILKRFASRSCGNELPPLELRRALERLVASDTACVVSGSALGRDRYSLTAPGRDRLRADEASHEENMSKVLSTCFRSDPEHWRSPFLKALSLVFARYGHEVARQVLGSITNADLLSHMDLVEAVDTAARNDRGLNRSVLARGVARFFDQSDPEAAELKWHFAQAYYTAQIVGLDPHGRSLAEAVLHDVFMYVDANVLIAALDPRQTPHRATKALLHHSKSLAITWVIPTPTLDEFNRFLADLSPSDCRDSPALGGLARKVKEGERIGVEEILSSMGRFGNQLRAYVRIDTDDEDVWFGEAKGTKATADLMEILINKAQNGRRPKTVSAAEVDALNLQRVSWRRRASGEVGWLLTADLSLPGPYPRQGCHSSVALTVDAATHWIGPFTRRSDVADLQQGFAMILRSRLMPRAKVLSSASLRLCEQTQTYYGSLHKDEALDTIELLRSVGPGFDLQDPDSADDLETAVRELVAHRERRREAVTRELSLSTRRADELAAERDEVVGRAQAATDALKRSEERSERLVHTIDELRTELRMARLGLEAVLRLGLVGMVAGSIITFGILATYPVFGDLQNPSYWGAVVAWVALVSTACIGVGRLALVGEERWRALRSPQRLRLEVPNVSSSRLDGVATTSGATTASEAQAPVHRHG